MSPQRTKTVWAVALIAVLAISGMLAEGDAEERQRSVLMYCEGVVIWEVEELQGVPLENRVGHRDWDDRINVAEQCPGMRPAAPAATRPQLQLVQF